ncbi:MAG: tRNA (adenosine(37)-N6)-dimethylallyltransferase MiaA, partial [Propionibacteriaceae bacterium]|nr:tRNA (adenosine(37)-N6)-dimethylallyltransferase MiaA [Propionibacteriaceae bacterium]
EHLLHRGLRQGRTASRAIGYRQIIAYLSQEMTQEQAKELTVTRTRQFSRKQLAWFRRDPRIVWFDAAATAEIIAYCQGQLVC